MKYKKKTTGFWTAVPPWFLIGATIVLLPLFTFMTVENINRNRENSIQLLVEKGAALIRSFEAGTRTGLMGDHFSGEHLQKLLSETALQEDIVYLAVVDTNGIILAHNSMSRIGYPYGTELDLEKLSRSPNVNHRIIETAGKEKVFEVFSKFAPTGTHMREPNALRMFRQLCRPHMRNWRDIGMSNFIIFIGLDMKSVEEARREDIRHAVLTAGILLLIGLTGIILIFITHNYRETKVSLSRIEAFSDNLVENMPIGLIAIDSHKRIASFNHLAESFFIHLNEANIGKDVAEIIPRELWQLIESPNIQKGIVEKEIDCSVNDGRTIPLEVTSTLLNDKDDNFLGYLILFKDMSEIKSLKKIVARSQRLASVGRLAAGVAHEIRNPLSSIKGFATYFKERYHNFSEDKQTAEIMIQEVDRLNRVVSQLLEFAKPVKVSAQPVDIRKLLEDSLKLIEKQIQEKNIKIETDFSVEVEKAFIDSDKINQVLLNLYLNAIDAMKDGGTIAVLLRKHEWKKGIEIVIQDTGSGIDEKDLPNIFDPYFTTKSTGTGIGLAIVHNIIEAHNGEIKVESPPGKGTKFIVYLSDLSRVENET